MTTCAHCGGDGYIVTEVPVFRDGAYSDTTIEVVECEWCREEPEGWTGGNDGYLNEIEWVAPDGDESPLLPAHLLAS